MQAPEYFYMVVEKRTDGTEHVDPFEFRKAEDAQERMHFLVKNARESGRTGSSFEIERVMWLHEV